MNTRDDSGAPEMVLVTGASSGIGRALARCFAADGSRLLLAARREAELESLADELRAEYGIEVEVVPADLGTAAGVDGLLESLAGRALSPDILVNNAGFGARGAFAEMDARRIEGMLAVNVEAVTRLARALLPAMRRRGRGGILNVASTAAFQPGPWMAVYYATKAYVLSLSEALHEECRGDGVHVTALCPGATDTGFAEEADMTDTPLFRLGAMDVATVARAGYAGLRAGRAVVVPGLRNRIGAASVRFTPRALVRRLVARLQH